jgi:signal transduction histidine kinase
VELDYTFQPELGKVKVDPDRIKEALANLTINGCEAMETGGRIFIGETRENHETMGEVAVVTISDSGPGIPNTIIDKVTTPFFTTKEDGSGLGLSIVARIIKEHNGNS